MSEKAEDSGKLEIVTPQGHEEDDKPKKMRMAKKNACDSCGKCCGMGGPVLQKEDMGLLMSGTLSQDSLYAVREGELVFVPGEQEPKEFFIEVIKVKEKNEGGECFFYEGSGTCRIYENRPAQCRDYQCWAPSECLTGIDSTRILRKDIFGGVPFLMDAIARHNEKCSYEKLGVSLARAAGGDEEGMEDVIDMLQYDNSLRELLKEKLGITPDAADLVLGRPLIKTINAFGFYVVQEGETFTIMPIETERKETP
ncbi:MAG: YkgJ family cysteine cluster protein [Nitrospirae bacterium]|nr:MAG: YkgJ family cysteine cluster protein [Nitrospirota bacterium]